MKPIKKIVGLVFSNRLLGGLVVVALLSIGYWVFSIYSNNEVEAGYLTETVEIGELVSSLSGNGQVSASGQVDLKFKASGDLTYLGVVVEQKVRKGTLIASLDISDAEKTIRDAEVDLESSQLSLEKLLKPASDLDIMQAENSLAQANESKSSAEADLEETYEESFNAVSNAFLDLPSVIVGLQNILFSDDLSGNSQWNVSYYGDVISSYNESSNALSDLVYDTYMIAKDSYDKNFNDYKKTSRSSGKEEVENLISQTYLTARNISDAIKNLNNLIQLYQDEYSKRNLEIKPLSNTQLSSLNSYTGIVNGVLSDLLNVKNTIKNKKEEIINATRSIAEKEGSFAELIAGADEYDIRSANINISQKENSLADAKKNLSDFYIYAPFDGTIASVDVKKGDTVTSGTVIATLITNQMVAEIFLNEIEIAGVQVGQKVNLKFDAVEDSLLEGEVIEIDTIGTVSSGVVDYGVKISFDTSNQKIKPGMSVNAEIILDKKIDTLIVSNTAITSISDKSFVQVLENGQSVRRPVTVGMVTDLKSEIIDGLVEGDQVVIGKNTVVSPNLNGTSAPGVSGFGARGGSSDMQVMRMIK